MQRRGVGIEIPNAAVRRRNVGAQVSVVDVPV